jgi:arylsulfatase A-like enzyme
MDGISFVPSLMRREQTNQHELFVWSRTNRHAVRMGDWKGIQTTNLTWELYDLAKDPQELTNAVAEKPLILQSITNALNRWLKPEEE